jgi:hypothetical protein
MIDREEYFRKVMKNTVKISIQTLLRTTEFSRNFLVRGDKKNIDKELDKISDDVMDLFIKKLKEKGYLEDNKEPSQSEFERLLKETVQDYFGEKSASNPK